MSTIERMADAIAHVTLKYPLQEGIEATVCVSYPVALRMAKSVLQVLREPGEGILAAMSDTPGMKEVDGMVLFCGARNPSHVLGWRTRGEPPPLAQAFTAAIDHIIGEAE